MKVVLASHNKKKMVEMKTILSAMGVEVLSQADVGVDLEPEETGTTFEENAKIKAVEIMPEDFERTPKRSIKRYLYQRNSK